MSRELKAGDLVVDTFSAIDLDGYSKVTGLTAFTVTVLLDGAVDATSVSISEIGTTGDYKVEFTPSVSGFYQVQVLIDYNKDIWSGEYDIVEFSQSDIAEILYRILGLSQENVFIDNTSYDVDSQLLSSRVRIFDSEANCDLATPGGTETAGLISTYTQTTTWSAVNRFRSYKQVRDE